MMFIWLDHRNYYRISDNEPATTGEVLASRGDGMVEDALSDWRPSNSSGWAVS